MGGKFSECSICHVILSKIANGGTRFIFYFLLCWRFVKTLVGLARKLNIPPKNYKVPVTLRSFQNRVKVSRTRYEKTCDLAGTTVVLVEEGEAVSGSTARADFPPLAFTSETESHIIIVYTHKFLVWVLLFLWWCSKQVTADKSVCRLLFPHCRSLMFEIHWQQITWEPVPYIAVKIEY